MRCLNEGLKPDEIVVQYDRYGQCVRPGQNYIFIYWGFRTFKNIKNIKFGMKNIKCYNKQNSVYTAQIMSTRRVYMKSVTFNLTYISQTHNIQPNNGPRIC